MTSFRQFALFPLIVMYTKLRSLLGKYIRYLDSGKRFVLHYIDASGFNFNVRLERINKISPTYIA